MPDLVIDEAESNVVKQIFHLIVNEGYGTNRVANWLNDKGIKTKKGQGFWRGTSIRALIENPIYIGVMKFGAERSESFENLRIIDDEMFKCCLETVKERAPKLAAQRTGPVRTDSRSLLTGLLYCKHCGCRLTFGHNCTKRKLADGTIRQYDRDVYRCYRKINAKKSCSGPSTYCCDKINEAVVSEVSGFFSRVLAQPKEEMIRTASQRKLSVLKAAYDQAVKDETEAKKQMAALEDQLMKALTGEEGGLDIGVINALVPKYRDKLAAAKDAVRDAQARMDAEKVSNAEVLYQYGQFTSWAEQFASANIETRHMILARLIDSIEVGEGYNITIHYNLTAQEYASPVV